MTSLLARIDQLLVSGSDGGNRAELLGEKACYLARAGDFDASAAVIQAMRARWGNGNDVRAMVWIMLAEGLIQYFSRLSEDAWDRIRRASSIARAANLGRLHPLTLAWLAHIEFFRSDYQSMGRAIAQCRTALGADSDDVQLRMALVMADATMYSGDHQGAQGWYERARNLAVCSADRIAIGALIYNRSMLGLSRVLVDQALGATGADLGLLKRYELELNSAAAFDIVSRTGVFVNQIRINLARARISTGEYQIAWESLLRVQESSPASSRTISCLTADLALCAAGLGKADTSRALVMEFLQSGFGDLDADEQVLALASALKATTLSGWCDLRDEVRKYLDAAVQSFAREMSELSESLRVAAP